MDRREKTGRLQERVCKQYWDSVGRWSSMQSPCWKFCWRLTLERVLGRLRVVGNLEETKSNHQKLYCWRRTVPGAIFVQETVI
jgi:hypothetical protein